MGLGQSTQDSLLPCTLTCTVVHEVRQLDVSEAEALGVSNATLVIRVFCLNCVFPVHGKLLRSERKGSQTFKTQEISNQHVLTQIVNLNLQRSKSVCFSSGGSISRMVQQWRPPLVRSA